MNRTFWVTRGLVAGVSVVISTMALAAPVEGIPAKRTDPNSSQPKVAQDAVKKFESGDAAGALKLLEQAEKENPQLPPAEVMLANLYLSSKQSALGRASMEKALLENPKDPEPNVAFGEIALGEGRISDAESEFERASRLLEKFTGDADRKKDLQLRGELGLAGVAEARQQWPKAEKMLTKFVTDRPANVAERQRLAVLALRQDKPDAALEQCQAAVKNNPDAKLNANLMMASAAMAASKIEDAGKWLKKAITEQPKELAPQLGLARWAMETENWKEADAALAAAEKLEPENADIQLLQGIAARYTRAFDRAESKLESVRVLLPGNFAATNQLALTLADQEDRAKRNRALELATANVQANPNNLEAVATLGWVAFRVGDFATAEKALGGAVRNGNRNRDTLYGFARILARRGAEEDARKVLKETLDRKGPFAHKQEADRWMAELAVADTPAKKAAPKTAETTDKKK